jgi:hypothetical protein
MIHCCQDEFKPGVVTFIAQDYKLKPWTCKCGFIQRNLTRYSQSVTILEWKPCRRFVKSVVFRRTLPRHLVCSWICHGMPWVCHGFGWLCHGHQRTSGKPRLPGSNFRFLGRLGWTALHLAASYGHVEVAQYLAERWPQLVQSRQPRWEILDLDISGQFYRI